MKRTMIFLLTNLAVMAMLMISAHVICAVFGVQLQEVFGDYTQLVVFAFVLGLGGSFVSLLLSKTMAKLSTGAKTIDGSEGPAERWLVQTVGELAGRANVKMPEVAIYPGAANAFATGAFRDAALVAVSTEIMGQMSREELRAVLGHEMSHVANGDMVTMTLVQGVLNSFVIFGAHLVATLAENALNNDRRGRRRGSMGLYYLVYHVMNTLFGLLAALVSCAFSRRREYAADAGSARLLGSPLPMIAALRRLGNLKPGVLPDSIKAFGIAGARKASPWDTHPALEDRIAALSRI